MYLLVPFASPWLMVLIPDPDPDLYLDVDPNPTCKAEIVAAAWVLIRLMISRYS